MEEANVSASLSVPKSVADVDIPEVKEAPASDALLNATRRIGGQRGYCTTLMQQFWLMLNEKEYRRAREVVELKAQLEKSHEVYAASVEEFCKSLDQGSPRYQEYMLQLNSRTVELADLHARVAEFMFEGIEERSATASNTSRGAVRFRKEMLSGCGGTVKSNSTMSSASKLRLEVKLSEMRLRQAKNAARLQSQQTVLEAATAVLEARIRAEAMEEQAFEEPAGVDPEKTLHDKVDGYLQSLPPSGPPPLESRSPAFFQMAHSTPDAPAHDLPSHSEVNSSLSFPPPVISMSSPGDSNPGASNLNVQAESWQPQSFNAVGVETLASHGPAITDLGRPPVCPSEPSFLPGSVFPRRSVPGPSFSQGSALPRSSVPGPSFLWGSALPRSSVPEPSFSQGSALPRSSVQSSTQFSPHFPALFGDNAQSSHVSVQSATDVQPPSVTSSIVADRLASDPQWSYTQPRPASAIINPAACGSDYNFENESGASCPPAGPDPGGTSIDDFARVLVRCQSSRALTDEERYSGDPLHHHQFI